MKQERKQIRVEIKGKTVGTLAITQDRFVAFQYDSEWLNKGFSISPFSLPLTDSVFVPRNRNFDGLHGIFADSLPDAWGRLVLDRMLLKENIRPDSLNPLDRLAIVGRNGMGALEYIPEYRIAGKDSEMSIQELADESAKILESRDSENLDQLFRRCGSSGGARPKAFVQLDKEEWIVKFPYSKDAPDAGKREYEYSVLAKECGIHMPETRLLPSKTCSGYFAVKRFDRPKTHMISAAALLEIDFERSLTDYSSLFKLTNILTNGKETELEELFRRMCFNVFGENQDDHLKNFSFLYDEEKKIWRLSPAYDLTHSVTGYGEHTTTVNGKGKDIQNEDLMTVGRKVGLKASFCRECIEKAKDVFRISCQVPVM